MRGYQSQNVARFAAAESGAFSPTAPFAAEGRLGSESEEAVTSIHSQAPCLGYRVKVDFCYLVSDGEDSEKTERKTLFDQREQVPDLALVFKEGSCNLNLELLKTFYAPAQELDDLPAYVADDGLPESPPKTYWFEVSESLFIAEQQVTAVGQVDQFQTLGPPPGHPEPVVYPGNRKDLVEKLKVAGKRDIIFGFLLIGLGLGAVGLIWLMKKYG